jgi:ParB family chromosome partitioning protein
MAKAREDMLASVAQSMGDPPKIHGESNPQGPAPRPTLERQGEGRRRLDTGAVIQVGRIVPDPAQPRQEFDPEALARLAESIRARGQLQPIRVRWDDAASVYVIVVGERRWRAARLAGLETVACVVSAGAPSAEDLLEDQLVENCVREDLKPIEQARAFQALMARRGLSQRELAERLTISQPAVARAVALLGLPDEVQAAVDAGALAPDAAYHISQVADPEAQAQLAARVVAERMTRSETAAAVKDAAPRRKGGGKPARRPAALVLRVAGGRVTVELKRGVDDAAAEAALAEALGLVRARRGASSSEAA